MRGVRGLVSVVTAGLLVAAFLSPATAVEVSVPAAAGLSEQAGHESVNDVYAPEAEAFSVEEAMLLREDTTRPYVPVVPSSRLGASARVTREMVEDVAMVVQGLAERLVPDDEYGGTWITEEDPPTIVVASTAMLSSRDLLDGLPQWTPLEVRRVTVSLKDLTKTADLLQHRPHEAGELGRALSTVERVDLAVQPQHGRVVAYVPEPDYDRVASEVYAVAADEPERPKSRTALPAPVAVARGSAAPACSRANCRPEMMAGLTLQRTLGTNSCSAGFAMVDSSGNRFATSAAHCSGTNRYHGGAKFGEVTDELQRGVADVERIDPTSGTWQFPGQMWIQASDVRGVLSHITHGNIVIGTQVGKSGYKTGATRGNITSKDFRPGYVPSSSNFVTASACVDNGDSGGPVFRQNTAYGIVSGKYSSCGSPGHFMIFMAAGYMMGTFNAGFIRG